MQEPISPVLLNISIKNAISLSLTMFILVQHIQLAVVFSFCIFKALYSMLDT